MKRQVLHLVELGALVAAAAPVVRLEWWAAAITAPAIALAFAADRLARES